MCAAGCDEFAGNEMCLPRTLDYRFLCLPCLLEGSSVQHHCVCIHVACGCLPTASSNEFHVEVNLQTLKTNRN